MLILTCACLVFSFAACANSGTVADVNVEVEAGIENTEYNYHTKLYEVTVEVKVLNYDEEKCVNKIDYTLYFYDAEGNALGSYTLESEEVVEPRMYITFNESFDGVKGLSAEPGSVYAVPISVKLGDVKSESDPIKWVYLGIALFLTVVLAIASIGCISNDEFGSLFVVAIFLGIPTFAFWLTFLVT